MARDMSRMYSWRRENIQRMAIDFNKNNEKDVLDWLDKIPNKREYIIELIRRDMKKDQ